VIRDFATSVQSLVRANLQQAYLLMGAPGVPAQHPDRDAVLLLTRFSASA